MSAGPRRQFRRRGGAVPTKRSGWRVSPDEEEQAPLYHFDLVNTKTVMNEGSAELQDDVEAMDSADTIARRILSVQPTLRDRRYFILVTNEDGEEIFRLPLEIIH